LVARRAGRLERTGKKGGDETGPNPTDRGKPGSKHHVLVDARGLPLAMQLGPANEHDSKRFEDLLDGVRPVRGRRGPPRKRPTKLHADKGYDYPRCRRACRDRGIASRIARRGVESSERLGRYRWVVERTLAWLHRFRRLAVRYERRPDIHRAFLRLGCALISFKFVERFCKVA
jgi:transposase